MVRLRLDQRLQGRVDPEDVLDEAFRDVLQHAREYVADPKVSPFVWLRELTNRRLTDVQHSASSRAADAARRYRSSMVRSPR